MRKIITAFMMLLCATCMASAANYLTFTAEEDSSTFGIVNNKNTPDVQYSLDDGKTWVPLSQSSPVVLVHKGDKALVAGINSQGFSKGENQFSTFKLTGKLAASGSVMSLIDSTGLSTEIPNEYCFQKLFSGCTSLTQAPELPATKLSEYCYWGMFSGCTSLTQAPELPATELAINCYKSMFSGCTSLTQAPALPATDLAPSCYYEMFSGCTSLTQAPELPATKLPKYCYWEMFMGCTSLTQAPELPATSLNTYCYRGMFSGCTSLTQAPELPAMILVEYCYYYMFSGCTSLTQAPELPAMVLAEDCYSYMFQGCTSLTQAPELPATNLAASCYWRMFMGCTSLTQVPELPAVILSDYCYFGMFMGCTSLTQVPALPATRLAKNCYAQMFKDCTNLSEISVAFVTWGNFDVWVENVSYTGTFICPGKLPLEYGKNRIPLGWEVKNIVDGDTVDVPINRDYLTFTAEEDGSSFEMKNYNENDPEVHYSLDGGETWTRLLQGDTILLAHKGDKALLRGGNPQGFSKGEYDFSTFKMTGKVAASGNVMSLIDGSGTTTKIPSNYCFCKMFSDCTSLTQAPELPATTLASYCYWGMFLGCTSLTQSPALPATTLAEKCYYEMFSGCTGLTQAQDLSATTMAGYSCQRMFYNCTSLTQAPALPATTLSTYCYDGMFSGCTSLTQAPELPATSLNTYCYRGMFSGCTSLTQAPELPATILKDYCYADMFSGCTSLTEVPELPATALIDNCYNSMFKNCTGLTRAYLLFVDMNLNVRLRCLSEMFSGCTNLSEISVVFDEWSGYTQYWVYNVAPTGTFYCPKALPLEYGVDRIPEGWTVKYIDDTVAAETNYLTFTAEEDSSSFGIVNNGGNNPDVQYSLDGGKTWIALAGGEMVTLAHKGDKALLKGNNPEGFSKDWRQYSAFKMTGKVAASGSVMSLIDGLGLSTEILWEKCFVDLFENCTSLTQAPELPATVLSTYCYDGMFSGCTSLTQAPELPATILADNCYGGMFYHCTSLTQAPELPATTLAEGCYYEMFSGCTNLSEIKVSFDDWNDGDYTLEWVLAVAPTGTFICPKDLPLVYRPEGIPEGWTVKYIDDTVAAETNYLTFTAEEDSSSFGIVNNEGNNPDVQYSLDGGKTWTTLAARDTITLSHKGDKALLKGNNPQGFSKNVARYSSFTMTGEVAASGSVMSLIDGTGLSTKIPNNYCFHMLFNDCTSLTRAPELPADSLTYSCYYNMFYGCTSLTRAPELSAMTLAEACYEGMFVGCTSLTQAPELPAVTLANYCYAYMFYGCTSLMRAPELSAMTLAEACYLSMFYGCTSLAQAPALPATTLPTTSGIKGGCYGWMFSGCTSLSQIRVSFDDWNDGLHTAEWVENVAPTGTFICPKDLPLEYGVDRIPEGWTVKFIDDTVAVEANYLTFTAEEDGSSFGIVSNEGNNPDVQYSLDGGKTWTTLAVKDAITLAHKGDKALLRGDNPDGFSRFLSPWTMYTSFTMTGKIAASGSVMSLIDGIGETLVIPNDICFYKLFFGCASLTQAPELPATTLAGSCYEGMFSGCTSLTQAPKLPATTLAKECYREMFRGCTSLAQAPKLPATTLAGYCYCGMFDGCTGLTEAPELPVTTLAEWCYYGMFSGCTRLTQAPVLPANTLAGYCYSRMFQGCTSLTQAPALPATTLSGGCYSAMFRGCTNLTQAPELPATTLAGGCYSSMFSGCTSLAQAPELPATTMAFHCYEYMFYGCTSLTKAPELPATELPDSLFMRGGCCESMFSGCTNLSEISIAFDKWNDNTFEWVKDVAPTGTFICPKELPLEYGVSRIPEGWTVKYIEDMPNYLTFTAEEDSSSFGIVNNGGNNPDVQYSLDGGATWIALAEGDTVVLAHKGDKALLKGNNPEGFSKDWRQYSAFKMTGKVAASGSVMSLIDGVGISTEVPGNYCFVELFKDCTSLTQAPELPATTLTDYCYYGIFSGCTSLTQTPELPATVLAVGCYSFMFSGCTSLTQAPALSATTLSEWCYWNMFSGCTSLTQAPALPATTLAENCYDEMFEGCTSLTQAPELPATTLAEDCYSFMFSGCTGLAQAPELPATTLAYGCYNGIFVGCESLSQIRVSFDEWSDAFTGDWAVSVAPTGTFICPKTLPLEYGDGRIPEGWTVKYIEDGSGVNTTLADNISVWSDDLTIFVRGAEGEVSLYDLSGKRVAVSNSADEERAMGVPAKGVYVVRTSGGERSVLVR